MTASASPTTGIAHSKRICAASPTGRTSCHAHVVTDANLHPLATSSHEIRLMLLILNELLGPCFYPQ
jgi:hypothetical protein